MIDTHEPRLAARRGHLHAVQGGAAGCEAATGSPVRWEWLLRIELLAKRLERTPEHVEIAARLFLEETAVGLAHPDHALTPEGWREVPPHPALSTITAETVQALIEAYHRGDDPFVRAKATWLYGQPVVIHKGSHARPSWQANIGILRKLKAHVTAKPARVGPTSTPLSNAELAQLQLGTLETWVQHRRAALSPEHQSPPCGGSSVHTAAVDVERLWAHLHDVPFDAVVRIRLCEEIDRAFALRGSAPLETLAQHIRDAMRARFAELHQEDGRRIALHAAGQDPLEALLPTALIGAVFQRMAEGTGPWHSGGMRALLNAAGLNPNRGETTRYFRLWAEFTRRKPPRLAKTRAARTVALRRLGGCSG